MSACGIGGKFDGRIYSIRGTREPIHKSVSHAWCDYMYKPRTFMRARDRLSFVFYVARDPVILDKCALPVFHGPCKLKGDVESECWV